MVSAPSEVIRARRHTRGKTSENQRARPYPSEGGREKGHGDGGVGGRGGEGDPVGNSDVFAIPFQDY